jgi:preprotein translocase subunit YajC
VLISNAFAATADAAPTAAQDPMAILTNILPMVFIFVVLWFMMLRPQMKRSKEHKALLEGLQKGDEVVTQTGIVGRVTQIGENYIHVEIAANTQVIVQRIAIGAVLPKGTIKAI